MLLSCGGTWNFKGPHHCPLVRVIHQWPVEYPHKWPATWWRHQMETFSALLALCAGNSTVSGEFPAQRPVTQSFDVFFDLRLTKQLSKHSWGWWFEKLSFPLWRHFNEYAKRFHGMVSYGRGRVKPIDLGLATNFPMGELWGVYGCYLKTKKNKTTTTTNKQNIQDIANSKSMNNKLTVVEVNFVIRLGY